MPSVLTEIGFLSNLQDKARLITAEGQQKIARRLADAFTRYCDDYAQQNSGSVQEPVKENVEERPEEVKPEEVKPDTSYNEVTAGQTFDKPSDVTYAIQIMASKKKLGAKSSEFKGLAPVARIYDKGFYKYCYGSFATRAEAAAKLSQTKKKFKDAFVVEIKNGKIAGR